MSEFTVQMSKETLDEVIEALTSSKGTAGTRTVAAILDDQRPKIPVPTRPRAVVRTTEGIAILADPVHGYLLPWMIAKNNDSYDWFESPPGRILEVLYEGDEPR